MDSVDLSVLKTLREWQASDLPLWLVTVMETFGSSPRPPGSMIALRGDGLAVGSVSGGCIEDDLVLRAQRGHRAEVDHRHQPSILHQKLALKGAFLIFDF